MNSYRMIGARRFGMVATTALAVSLGSGGRAVASPADSTSDIRSESTSKSQSDSASVANDTLTVTGSRGPDRITLRLAAGDPNTLQVDFGDGSSTQSFDRGTFASIDVFLLSGGDQFTEEGGFADEALTVNAGDGDDSVVGGDGNDVIFGGSGNDRISSGKGDDLIFSGRGDDAVDGGAGHDTAVLGSGQDSFVWDPGDGSDVVDGGRGTDTLVFNGSNGNETMSLSANGSRSVFLRDAGNIRMDMDNIERLSLATLGGVDHVTINDMSGTDFRRADIDLSAAGASDGLADVVTVNGTERADRIEVESQGNRVAVDGLQTETRITGSDAFDLLQVNTLGGKDRAEVGDNVSAQIGVAVDLGSGQY